MSDLIKSASKVLSEQIARFSAESFRKSYTDTGEAWDLLDMAFALCSTIAGNTSDLMTREQIEALDALGLPSPDGRRVVLERWTNNNDDGPRPIRMGMAILVMDGLEGLQQSLIDGHLSRVDNTATPACLRDFTRKVYSRAVAMGHYRHDGLASPATIRATADAIATRAIEGRAVRRALAGRYDLPSSFAPSDVSDVEGDQP